MEASFLLRTMGLNLHIRTEDENHLVLLTIDPSDHLTGRAVELSRSEARAIASALMGAAAEL